MADTTRTQPVPSALDGATPDPCHEGIADAHRLIAVAPRPLVRGKSLYLDGRKLTVKGVTYGPFGSEPGGAFEAATADSDFAQMAKVGVNAIRLYGPPEPWLLDLAHSHGLLVMVGIPWEQHIAFLDEPGRAARIEQTVRSAVRSTAGHPAVLCYAVGNEIPASIVRWHGRRRVERFVRRLCLAAREEDPSALLTYVNFPSTEYLRLPEIDFLAFNVYLEQRDRFEQYLARLQNLADDRPLLAEVGLDSRRNGAERQADVLRWQIEACSEAGCAGLFLFAWTDQWHRGGHEALDWDFGLTTRKREHKPALDVVREACVTTPVRRSHTCGD